MTSWWAWLRLKSPASRLFTQPFIQAEIKENIKAPRHWPLCGDFTGTGEFPAQMASNAENVSIWWRHRDTLIAVLGSTRLVHAPRDSPCGPSCLRSHNAYMGHSASVSFKLLYLCLSVCLSVCPSVCLSVTPFSLCFCHCMITKFSGVITNVCLSVCLSVCLPVFLCVFASWAKANILFLKQCVKVYTSESAVHHRWRFVVFCCGLFVVLPMVRDLLWFVVVWVWFCSIPLDEVTLNNAGKWIHSELMI